MSDGEGVDDTPFVDRQTFVGMYRPLSTPEENLADRLLAVAATWIRRHKPDVDQNDAAAQLVSVMVVRDTLDRLKIGPLSQFSMTRGEKMDSGTLDPGSMLDFTPQMYSLLGISRTASPRAFFGDRPPRDC
ncbi:hypothetical protein [Gordonia soli]|uniref:Head-to-tail adaptor n=1 Tax=Gordonia soli NBRC 108243 TaxID=1223545 RepID=M0QR30_9ACTN|nr:hypothetical protein [Gordonia soli]GAC70731.1 hypothetical protein GS4_39_00620 [Gordonia soli NBRC 108243]